MIKIVEAFSGIGSQAKALSNIDGLEYEIVATVEWDINAILAYDLIHHGEQTDEDLKRYVNMDDESIMKELESYTLSPDGKEPFKCGTLRRMNKQFLKKLLCAIRRTRNFVSITDLTGEEFPSNVDIFTYSFPCQDLSIAGVWHGNMSGINREVKNRSGMLWEVERILIERVNLGLDLPKFLLMENVSNLLAPRHRGNFQEWIDYLETIGYYNKVYKLNAKEFGIPQNRERVFMLSVFIGVNNESGKKTLDSYFIEHDLNNQFYTSEIIEHPKSVADILRTDYSNEVYWKEAKESQIKNTSSRVKIVEENDKLFYKNHYMEVIKTITTKQDRNPNSGIVEFNHDVEGKLNFRYLTPRECFLAMGFDEVDFDTLINNNFYINKSRKFFSDGKLIKMAGNSIVVNVLEAIFRQIIEISYII